MFSTFNWAVWEPVNPTIPVVRVCESAGMGTGEGRVVCAASGAADKSRTAREDFQGESMLHLY
jgi:hypothetical protein